MKKKLLIGIILCINLTGCTWSDTDYFGAGDSSFNVKQPYSNAEGFLTVNYDIKEVEARENDILNEFDFSGPMGSMLNQHSSASTVITEQEITVTPSVNPNLPIHSLSGFASPLGPQEVNVHVGDGFGPRTPFMTATGQMSSSYHQGVDLSCPAGTPEYAIMDGTIKESGYSSSRGNYIIIAFDDTSSGAAGAIYMHGLKDSRMVETGDHVRKGQTIMLVGSTGNSTGPHLHFGVYDTSWNYIDPANFIDYHWFD